MSDVLWVAEDDLASEPWRVSTEDSGMAKIAEINTRVDGENDNAEGLFVRVQSWDDDGEHSLFQQMVDAGRVRVTIEVLP